MSTDTDTTTPEKPRPARKFNWLLIGLLAVFGYFLFMEHRAHVLAFLPYALLLGCVLMHVFMHRGHGMGHGSSHGGGDKDDGR